MSFKVGDKVQVRRDNGSILETTVKYKPWQIGDGTWVIGLAGIAGGYALERVSLIPHQEGGRLA